MKKNKGGHPRGVPNYPRLPLGGRRTDRKGYVLVKRPDHPFSNSHGYIQEHRLVLEAHLGRYLKRTEVVHHRNGIPSDNRIENLQLCSGHAEHLKIHRPTRFCRICGARHQAKGLCRYHYVRQWAESVRVPCQQCGKPIERRRKAKARDGRRLCYSCRHPRLKCRVCGAAGVARGLCKRHWSQWKYGRPFTNK